MTWDDTAAGHAVTMADVAGLQDVPEDELCRTTRELPDGRWELCSLRAHPPVVPHDPYEWTYTTREDALRR